MRLKGLPSLTHAAPFFTNVQSYIPRCHKSASSTLIAAAFCGLTNSAERVEVAKLLLSSMEGCGERMMGDRAGGGGRS